MSTEISVSVALEGLRKLSQAQINANRQAKLLEDQRRKMAQEAVDKQQQSEAAQGRDLRGQLLYGIKSDQTKPQPAPVALRFGGTDVRLAWAWTRQTAINNAALSSLQTVSDTQIGGYYRAPTSRTFRIVSGDGSALLLVDLDMPEADAVRAALPADYSVTWVGIGVPGSLLGTNNFRLRPCLLPTGTDGVGILALSYHYVFLSQLLGTQNPGDPTTEFYRAEYANHRVKCFLVSPSAIRELTVPTAFREAVQAASTPWVIADGTNPAGPGLPPQPQIVASPTEYAPPGGTYGIDHGWWASTGISWFTSEDSVTTPLEYQRLDLVGAYDPPAVTVWIEPDFTTSPGLFLDYWLGGSGLLRWEEAINLQQPMRWRGRAYARGSVPGTQNAGDLPSLPALTRQISPSASVPLSVGSGGYRIHLSHDYGNRTACRANLLALGFTTADLTP